MSVRHQAVRIAAVTALLVGCAGQDDDAPGTSAEASPTAAAAADDTSPWTGPVIPDGVYSKTATMTDVRALGLPRARAKDFLGDDGEFHVELKITGDDYAQFGDDGDSPMTQGDGGTATYDAEGHWVTTSSSTGCPGCMATMGWTLDGDRLTLTLIETSEAGDPMDLLVGRLVFEGEFTRR